MKCSTRNPDSVTSESGPESMETHLWVYQHLANLESPHFLNHDCGASLKAHNSNSFHHKLSHECRHVNTVLEKVANGENHHRLRSKIRALAREGTPLVCLTLETMSSRFGQSYETDQFWDSILGLRLWDTVCPRHGSVTVHHHRFRKEPRGKKKSW